MPSVEGAIRSISLSEDFCCVKVLKTDDTTTFFLLWSDEAVVLEDQDKNRLINLARDSFSQNRPITLTHDDGSALVTSFVVE